MSDAKKGTPGVGGRLDVAIESVAFGGDGVARVDNYVIFVPDVIPGEMVTVEVTSRGRSFGRGIPLSIPEPSPDRVSPLCEAYGMCGGCQYQHMTYERSLDVKQQQVKEVLVRIGGLDVDDLLGPIRRSPDSYGYRNAVSVRVRKAKRMWQAGYTARDNETFVPVSHCPIASKPIDEALGQMETIVRGFENQDRIKSLVLKNAGARMLVLPVYRKPIRFKSEERLSFRYGDVDLSYGASSFFQVNHAVIPDLMELAREGLAPRPGETLLDLYAGVGLFSLVLAGEYRRVFGIEMGEEAVACFEENIRANGLRNVTAIRGAVEARIREARRELSGMPFSVLADPPREGMKKEVILFLNDMPVRRLVYVSCDPATLARDLKSLEAAYTLLKITPLDMFPQTKHIEAVAVLERRDA